MKRSRSETQGAQRQRKHTSTPSAPPHEPSEGDELPQGWATATIGDVAESMKNGVYKPADAYADNGVACLRMYNIEAGKVIWKDIKRMKLTPQEVREYQLLPGDLIVNRVNSRELVGKSAVIPAGLVLNLAFSRARISGFDFAMTRCARSL